jgi:hypothetical protein
VSVVNDVPPDNSGTLIGPPEPAPVRTLNPAHAILGGAVLSAIVTLVGVSLNIRSSERLSNERDKRDAAVAEASGLKDKVGDLERRLDDALAKIPSTAVDTEVPVTGAGVTTLAPPPQSIVVVLTIPSAPVSSPTAATTVAPKANPSTTAQPASTSIASSTSTPSTTSSTTSTTSTTTTPPA